MEEVNPHLRTDYGKICISGAGFLADAYDLFVINIAVDLMGKVSYHQPLTNHMKSMIKSMALAGAILGQLAFGAVADLIGRKKVFIATCILVICGSLLSAVVVDSTWGIFTQLCICRFFLGVGIGGEYPLSASVTSEGSTLDTQNRNLALVFSMQGVGTILCSLVLVSLTQTLGNDYNLQWRLALGLGAVPMICVSYFRFTMHEHQWRTTRDSNSVVPRSEGKQTVYSPVPSQVNGNADAESSAGGANSLAILENGDGNKSQSHCSSLWTSFLRGLHNVCLILYEERYKVLGTAGSWFILDIVFYANGLFSGQVTTSMRTAKSPKGEAIAALVLQSMALPGYICTVLYSQSVTMRSLQLGGFLSTGVCFLLLAILQSYLVKLPAIYVMLYGLTFFFQNFGPNATTYIIPSVIFPSPHRATCHGFSSAAGKAGALLGAAVFLYLAEAFCDGGKCPEDASEGSRAERQRTAGMQLTFVACGLLSLVGLLWSYVFVNDEPSSGNLSYANHQHVEMTTMNVIHEGLDDSTHPRSTLLHADDNLGEK
eukprot:gene31880-38546_t